MIHFEFLRITAVVTTFILLLGGCTNTTPTVSLLKGLNGLEFVSTEVVAASLSSVSLQAQCSSFVESIEVSFDSGSTWMSPTAHDPSASSACENGIFKMKILNTNAPLNAMSIPSGSVLQLQFRAKMRVSGWSQVTVGIKYSPSGSTSQEILAGGSEQTGAGMVLKGRIRAQSQKVSSGGDFVVRGRITQ